MKDVTWVSGGAGLAGLSKAMFSIGTAALRLGHCTRERPRACAHLYGTIASGPHVCVHTHSPIYINSQAWRALTAEGALRVDAAAVHTNARSLTLIDVWWREGRKCMRHVSASVYELRCVQNGLFQLVNKRGLWVSYTSNGECLFHNSI